MDGFVRIRGAKLQQTVRFAKVCNNVAGQTRPIPRDAKTASICCVKPLNRGESPLVALSLQLIAVCSAISSNSKNPDPRLSKGDTSYHARAAASSISARRHCFMCMEAVSLLEICHASCRKVDQERKMEDLALTADRS